jgi:hypothetical protein
MSTYQAGKLLFQMQHDVDLRMEFQSHPEDVLGRYDLSDEERRAIMAKDVAFFYVRGMNPLLLIATSWTMGVTMPEHRSALASIERRA